MRRINICSRLQGGEILSEIKIDVDSLESGINNLKELRAKLAQIKVMHPQWLEAGAQLLILKR